MKHTRLSSSIAAALLLTSGASMADSISLQQQLDALKAENQTIMERLNATMDMVESGSDNNAHGHGSKGKTTVGGYGELHYANTDSGKEMDMHRFIIYLGHEFNDRIRFFSETEIEHATSDPDGGEVAIEQAYLEFDVADEAAIRAGILLVPVGIINETHEPPTFYGVERNNVEKYILPTTWREGGISMVGRVGESLSYNVALHSGLQINAYTQDDNGNNVLDTFAVRGGRQAVREAPADNLAITAQLKWTGISGLEIGGAVQRQTDVTQSKNTSVAGAATLIEAHTVYQKQQFTLRALYASWTLDGTGPETVGADKQSGWYIEPSYKLTSQWGVYARQSSWDNTAGSSADTENTQTDIGFSYWPHEDVVIKANTQTMKKDGKDDNGFMLGVGYQF